MGDQDLEDTLKEERRKIEKVELESVNSKVELKEICDEGKVESKTERIEQVSLTVVIGINDVYKKS